MCLEELPWELPEEASPILPQVVRTFENYHHQEPPPLQGRDLRAEP